MGKCVCVNVVEISEVVMESSSCWMGKIKSCRELVVFRKPKKRRDGTDDGWVLRGLNLLGIMVVGGGDAAVLLLASGWRPLSNDLFGHSDLTTREHEQQSSYSSSA